MKREEKKRDEKKKEIYLVVNTVSSSVTSTNCAQTASRTRLKIKKEGLNKYIFKQVYRKNIKVGVKERRERI